MKKLFFMLSTVTVLSATVLSCGNSSENKSESTVKEKEAYACPMHPEVTSDKPETCSTCGMDLEATENK